MPGAGTTAIAVSAKVDMAGFWLPLLTHAPGPPGMPPGCAVVSTSSTYVIGTKVAVEVRVGEHEAVLVDVGEGSEPGEDEAEGEEDALGGGRTTPLTQNGVRTVAPDTVVQVLAPAADVENPA